MRVVALAAVLWVSVAACAPVTASQSKCVKTERGSAADRFRREHPCPAGPDAGSRTKCAGHQVHHIVPLMCGGPDALDNLVWLTTEQHKALHSAMICRCDVASSSSK
jgi:hypothetical protein